LSWPVISVSSRPGNRIRVRVGLGAFDGAALHGERGAQQLRLRGSCRAADRGRAWPSRLEDACAASMSRASRPHRLLVQPGEHRASSSLRTRTASLRRRPSSSPCARLSVFFRLCTCAA
jgi:hypothetical protein